MVMAVVGILEDQAPQDLRRALHLVAVLHLIQAVEGVVQAETAEHYQVVQGDLA